MFLQMNAEEADILETVASHSYRKSFYNWMKDNCIAKYGIGGHSSLVQGNQSDLTKAKALVTRQIREWYVEQRTR